MKLLIFLLFLKLNGAFEDCSEEFSGLSGECQCHDAREGLDVWCPNSERPKLRFHLQPQALWVECHNLEEAELRFFLKNVSMSLSTSVDTLEFKQCPFSTTSYGDLIDDMSLSGLEELRIQYGESDDNLVDNLFSGLESSLKRLYIINSQFAGISEDAFKGLTGLESLHLISNTGLESLDNNFRSLSSLISLEIVQPSIQKVSMNLFQPLSQLKRLKLHIGAALESQLFEKNIKLVSVEFSNLNGSSLIDNNDKSLFNAMVDLKNLTISGYDFGKLPENLFANNKELAFFEWRHDKCAPGVRGCIVQPPSFVKDVSSLRTFQIHISFTKGIVLNEDFFWGCVNLQSVKINRARLTTLPDLLFRDTKDLNNIDISKNKLESIPSKAFHYIRSLKTLNLANNQIQILDDEHLAKANQLEHLDISNNQLVNLSRNSLSNLVDLEELNLSNNRIVFNDQSQPDWRAMTGLQRLNLANNSISLTHIPDDFRTTYTQLSELNLARNNIGPRLEIFPDLTFSAIVGDLILDLSGNNISVLSYTSALKHNVKKRKIVIDLSNNPWICDCRNADLALHLRDKMQSSSIPSWLQFSTSSKNSALGCADKPQYTLDSVPLNAMTCSFPSKDLPNPMFKCPDNCLCSLTTYQSSSNQESSVLVNCSHQPGVPSFVPSHISSQVQLDLTLSALTNTSVLPNIQGLTSISELTLSQNNLTMIELDDLPSILHSLYIDRNHITYLEDKILQKLTNLKSLRLGNNPFSCDCDSKALFRFVQRNAGSIQDGSAIALECAEGSTPINSFTDYTEFCVETKEIVVAIALPVSLLILLVLTMIVLFLIYRDYISIWIYSKPALRPLFFNQDPADQLEKRFDVFISYSHMDRDFVEENMVPKLEDDPSTDFRYRCLVHVRDFVLGRPIVEQITEAVESSSCTLIVLSTSFVKSDWAKHEYEGGDIFF